MCCDGLLALFPLLPSFWSHSVHRTGREPGRSDHMHNDLLCVVLCVAVELLPMQTRCEFNRAGCLTVTALHAAQHDSKETLKDHNKQQLL